MLQFILAENRVKKIYRNKATRFLNLLITPRILSFVYYSDKHLIATKDWLQRIHMPYLCHLLVIYILAEILFETR